MPRSTRLAALCLLISLFSCQSMMRADVVIHLWEDGDHVRGQAEGLLDISGATFVGNFFYPSDFRMDPSEPELLFFGPGDLYSAILSTPDFGTGGLNISGTSSGDNFGFEGSRLVVPTGFVSGDAISSTGVFFNTSLADLGADIGTYTYLLPNDSITLLVGQSPAVIPEPASAMVGALAWGMLAIARRRRHKQ